MPVPDPVLFEEFEEFFGATMRELFRPLASDLVFSFEDWLDSTSYTSAFKDRLRTEKDTMDQNGGYFVTLDKRNRNMDVHTFTKDEHYGEYKHARCINGRVNETKILMGPVFKMIEQVVFAHPAFIKKIPISDRPQYMLDIFEGPGTVMDSDFSSLEATFVRNIMRLEVQFYLYMLRDREEFADAKVFLEEVLMGMNRCDAKFFTLWVEARRMSGENNTSLGNGLFNLGINLFAYHKLGLCWKTIKMILEGDDGKFKSPTGVHPSSAFYTRLGASIKITLVEDITKASFCGLVFDMEEKRNIADPRKVLADFGLTTMQYAGSRAPVHKGLLRSKALALAYQYPCTPIISALASYGLRVTSGHDTSALKYLRRERVYKWAPTDIGAFTGSNGFKTVRQLRLEANVGAPGPRTRLLMEELFDVSVEQQLRIESYLNSLTKVQPLEMFIDFPETWYHYAATFGVAYDEGNRVPFQPQNVRHLDLREYCELKGSTNYYS